LLELACVLDLDGNYAVALQEGNTSRSRDGCLCLQNPQMSNGGEAPSGKLAYNAQLKRQEYGPSC
jgi:hypothetical protein